MNKLRFAAGALLFLAVAIGFTSKVMSGVPVAMMDLQLLFLPLQKS
ncbi:hypothetical protein R2236_001507 [Cronobacter sakazakii]|nr:hypothetical protein [Cronobacter sakazakii]ELQ6071185.1 hypothetical protein [Cronobacter sakazakii]ELY2664763.1 hypothetical protein [Cronobacter sakazakii]ELY4372438.1 hypothetical protein [Cronobacter sakazakii]MBS4469414.1 hypothetical protein [Cronobacter sakazakii]MBS4469721.1 hypothetical protein [Cronobacter sakazakii]